MTLPCLVLAGYRLVMSGLCVYFTSMYVQSLPVAHTFATIWEACLLILPVILASYGVGCFLISYFLCLASFGGWVLPDYGLSFLQPTFLLFL